MRQDTQMHLLLLSELIAALRANDPDTFKQWLAGGAQDLGEHAVAELMLEWMVPLLTQDEADRLVGCTWECASKIQLLQCFCATVTKITGAIDAGQQLDR